MFSQDPDCPLLTISTLPALSRIPTCRFPADAGNTTFRQILSFLGIQAALAYSSVKSCRDYSFLGIWACWDPGDPAVPDPITLHLVWCGIRISSKSDGNTLCFVWYGIQKYPGIPGKRVISGHFRGAKPLYTLRIPGWYPGNMGPGVGMGGVPWYPGTRVPWSPGTPPPRTTLPTAAPLAAARHLRALEANLQGAS